MVDRAGVATGYPWSFFWDLAERALEVFGKSAAPPAFRALSAFIARDPGFLATWSKGKIEEAALDPADTEVLSKGARLEVRTIFLPPARMTPARDWSVPAIETERELLAFLSLHEDELELLAGLHARERRVPEGPLRNYVYSWKKKRRGGRRLVEAPKQRLKNVQRRIARRILAHVPPSDAAHGFRTARSITTHAREHCAQRVVLRMDLADFFSSISSARVIALFRTIGYPENIARLFAALATNATPNDVLRGLDGWPRALLRRRHLPQGAPTSPAIANLCAFRLDRRLSALARSFGAKYTRYADDLAFSGDRRFERRLDLFTAMVAAIAEDEGFQTQHRKTRVMREGVRQQLCGLTVNAHPNIARREYERLKAILHNAARSGPETQNRDAVPNFRASLAGRIAFISMVNPARGARLRAAFDRLVWT